MNIHISPPSNQYDISFKILANEEETIFQANALTFRFPKSSQWSIYGNQDLITKLFSNISDNNFSQQKEELKNQLKIENYRPLNWSITGNDSKKIRILIREDLNTTTMLMKSLLLHTFEKNETKTAILLVHYRADPDEGTIILNEENKVIKTFNIAHSLNNPKITEKI